MLIYKTEHPQIACKITYKADASPATGAINAFLFLFFAYYSDVIMKSVSDIRYLIVEVFYEVDHRYAVRRSKLL